MLRVDIVKPAGMDLLENSTVNTSIPGQWFNGRHVTGATLIIIMEHHTSPTNMSHIAKWWHNKQPSLTAVMSSNNRRTSGSAVVFVGSVPRLYHKLVTAELGE
jgi:hypothetical protein